MSDKLLVDLRTLRNFGRGKPTKKDEEDGPKWLDKMTTGDGKVVKDGAKVWVYEDDGENPIRVGSGKLIHIRSTGEFARVSTPTGNYEREPKLIFSSRSAACDGALNRLDQRRAEVVTLKRKRRP